MLPGKPPRKRGAYGLPADITQALLTIHDVQTIMAQGVNPDGSLKPRAIRALLKFKGREITDLAEILGFSEAYFRQVIDRIRRDWRVEDAIAQALDLEADRIWGRKSEGAA